jgi:hypothetical protein
MNQVSIAQKIDVPLIVELNELDADSFIRYYLDNKKEIENDLLKTGAVKFRGITIDSLETFQKIVDSISDKFLSYIDGNSPRTKLSGNVYTSTEYDKTQRITMHNELSYSAKWPNKLFFSCLRPAETGGETLLADSREILKRMDKKIVSEIKERGVMYIRNLHSGMGMGPSWQDTFETEDKSQLEAYCKSYSIDIEWTGNGNLRLKQPSKGIIQHRHTKEEVWFNQIDQFHPIQLGEEVYEMMKAMYHSQEDFPMYVKFGDGKKIEEGMIKDILETIEEITIAPPWEKNELLIVDNELVSHGRSAYTGNRTVVVSMSE